MVCEVECLVITEVAYCVYQFQDLSGSTIPTLHSISSSAYLPGKRVGAVKKMLQMCIVIEIGKYNINHLIFFPILVKRGFFSQCILMYLLNMAQLQNMFFPNE